MGLTLVGLTTAQRGNEVAEVGINLESFSCEYAPQFKDKLNNFQGQAIGFAITDKPTRTISIKGEVLTGVATGWMAAAFATAIAPANDVAAFGVANTGGFYPDSMTESQSRDGWRTVEIKATSDPLIA